MLFSLSTIIYLCGIQLGYFKPAIHIGHGSAVTEAASAPTREARLS
jgi:hypothetical protein